MIYSVFNNLKSSLHFLINSNYNLFRTEVAALSCRIDCDRKVARVESSTNMSVYFWFLCVALSHL